MSKFRYVKVGLSAQELDHYVPANITAVSELGRPRYVDVTIDDDDSKADLDEAMAARGYEFVDSQTQLDYCASNKLLESAMEITETEGWELIGGSVTTLAAFVPDPSLAWGRVVGQVKVSGEGAKLRVTRYSDGLECTSEPFVCDDTGGTWANVTFWVTQNQPAGTDCFLLEGQLNGATSFEVRFFTISLLERLV